jgi:hypothetical protein
VEHLHAQPAADWDAQAVHGALARPVQQAALSKIIRSWFVAFYMLLLKV